MSCDVVCSNEMYGEQERFKKYLLSKYARKTGIDFGVTVVSYITRLQEGPAQFVAIVRSIIEYTGGAPAEPKPAVVR